MRLLFAVPLVIAVMVPIIMRVFLDNHRTTMGLFPLMTSSSKWGYSHADIPDLTGKRAVVTGANVGLGFATALNLALRGAETHVVCRSERKCAKAVADIRARAKDQGIRVSVFPAICDLSDLSSVRAFATAFATKHKELHILILNAGVMHSPYTLTTDNLEIQIAVNHVAHHYLANLLLPLARAASIQQPASIVSVTSNAMFNTYAEGVKLNEASLNDEASYDAIKAYGQSKLANMLFIQELAERVSNENIFVNAAHPGAVFTELTRNWPVPEVLKSAFDTIYRAIAWDANDAALTQLYCATSPQVVAQNVRGKMFAPIARLCEPADHAKDRTLQTDLWTFTDELLGKRGFTYVH